MRAAPPGAPTATTTHAPPRHAHPAVTTHTPQHVRGSNTMCAEMLIYVGGVLKDLTNVPG